MCLKHLFIYFISLETSMASTLIKMEQHSLKNVNNNLNTNIYSYFETSGGQCSDLYLNVVHFFNASVN
jgi:hypothetical protein